MVSEVFVICSSTPEWHLHSWFQTTIVQALNEKQLTLGSSRLNVTRPDLVEAPAEVNGNNGKKKKSKKPNVATPMLKKGPTAMPKNRGTGFEGTGHSLQAHLAHVPDMLTREVC